MLLIWIWGLPALSLPWLVNLRDGMTGGSFRGRLGEVRADACLSGAGSEGTDVGGGPVYLWRGRRDVGLGFWFQGGVCNRGMVCLVGKGGVEGRYPAVLVICV